MGYTYKIIKHIATLSKTEEGTRQVNLISHNNSKPKYDIRDWDNEGNMIRKHGIMFDENEWAALGKIFDTLPKSNQSTRIPVDISWLIRENDNTYKMNLSDLGIKIDCESEFIINEDEKSIKYIVKFEADEGKTQKCIEFLNDVNKDFSKNKILANAYIDSEHNQKYICIAGIIPMQISEPNKMLDSLGTFFSDYLYTINELGIERARELYIDNVIVVGDLLSCVHEEHKKEELLISVLFVKKNGDKIKVETKASYCEKCNLFFMRKHDYWVMKSKVGDARMLCQEIEYERYCKKPDLSNLTLNDHSILNVYGYNVNATENLTHSQRHEILAGMVDRKVITKERIASYLAFFIKGAQNRRIDMRDAVEKWNIDRDFILDYKVGSRRTVEPTKITVIKYKPTMNY